MMSPGGRRTKRQPKRPCPESDVDMGETLLGPGMVTTRSKRSASRRGSGRQNQGESADQMCTTPRLETGELKKGNRSGAECTSSPQPRVQSVESFEEVLKCESNKPKIDREGVFEWVESILQNRNAKLPEKLCSFRERLSEVFDCQENGHNDHIAKLNQVHLSEIAKWKDECNSLRKDKEAALQENREKLKVAGMSFFEVLMEAGKERFKNFLEAVPETTTNSVHAAKHDQSKDTQQIRQINSSESLELTLGTELHKTSHEIESSEKLKVRPEANGDQNVRSGSYRDGSATPNLLQVAYSKATVAVNRFQKVLFEGVNLARLDEATAFLNPNVSFEEQKHSSQYVKSLVYANLFEGFEKEGFNLSSNVSRFPLNSFRQANFYEYYLNQREQNTEDPEFEEFYKAKYALLWKMTVQTIPLSIFFQFDLPQLKPTFIQAAKTVWLLHKLAFSFEPPASILRVEVGANIDLQSMDWGIVNPEDDERFIDKVGFMISPGMLLRERVVVLCTVYPASASTIQSRPKKGKR